MTTKIKFHISTSGKFFKGQNSTCIEKIVHIWMREREEWLTWSKRKRGEIKV